MQQNKQIIIDEIIQKKYYKKQQTLSIYYQGQYYSDILLARDWSIIKTLRINQSRVTDDSISILFRLKWPQLLFLCLEFNRFTSTAMELMINCSLINIKVLNLSYNLIGNQGVKHLVKSNLPNLVTLVIRCCQIRNEGLKHFTKGHWANLNNLYLGFESNEIIKQRNLKPNKINLNGWSTINLNLFKIKKLQMSQTQPIYWIGFILLPKQGYEFDKYGIMIQNQKLKELIKRILINKMFCS